MLYYSPRKTKNMGQASKTAPDIKQRGLLMAWAFNGAFTCCVSKSNVLKFHISMQATGGRTSRPWRTTNTMAAHGETRWRLWTFLQN